jgi:signal transduction histidine kinase
VDLNPERIDLVDTAAEILTFLEPEAAAHHIRTSLVLPAGDVFVQGGRDLLRQALLNIAVNAIEAMEQGGQLTLRVERHAETCMIAIADTGPGIPADQLETIFQLYYTTRPRGTGIGLAMAFRAAQLHGGTIEVTSEMGKGTEFRIVLPLAPVQDAA